MKKIGIIGLGIMGRGMATNFLKAGYEVFVWNRTKAVSEQLENKGASVCESPKELAAKVNIVFEVTANDESSQQVWEGEDGILSGADKDTVVVASATLSIKWIDQLTRLCEKKGLQFLDIPLTGGRIGAETGTLTMLCGGNPETLEHIKPYLKAVASKIFHFGPTGHGMRYKLILNYLQAAHVVAFGQAMKIAETHTMDLKKVSEGLADRPGGVITQIAQRTYFEDPNPITFSIEWITKDLTYAKQFAEGIETPILDAVLAEYKKAIEKGYEDKDWASVNTLELN